MNGDLRAYIVGAGVLCAAGDSAELLRSTVKAGISVTSDSMT